MGKGRESGMPVEDQWGAFFDPACVLAKLDCVGAIGDVIEFGCGYGTFTIPAAQMIEGRVLAFDIEPDMVAATVAKASAAHLSNVVAEVRDFVAEGCVGWPMGRPDMPCSSIFCISRIPSICSVKRLVRWHPVGRLASSTGAPISRRLAAHLRRFAQVRNNVANGVSLPA